MKGLFVISYLSLVAPFLALAQITGSTPGEYVQSFYRFALLISGALAFGAIVYGGIKYTFAAGNPSGQSEGKEWVKGALLGLLLLAAAGIILRTINPNLVNLSDLPGLPPGDGEPPPENKCPGAQMLDLRDPFACGAERGATLQWGSQDMNVRRNLIALGNELDKFKSALGSIGATGIGETSAYRPPEYQNHLSEVVTKWNQWQSNTDSKCIGFKSFLQTEKGYHQLGKAVSEGGNCAPHAKGVAIDLNFTLDGATLRNGKSCVEAQQNAAAVNQVFQNKGYAGIQDFLDKKGVGLVWSNISCDPIHFELKNPPYTGCNTYTPSGDVCFEFTWPGK